METEKTVKHTPGPWGVEHASDGYLIVGYGNPSGGIAELCLRRSATGDATAHLIAAAPALLAACEALMQDAPAILRMLRNHNVREALAFTNAMTDARAAIKQAKGGK